MKYALLILAVAMTTMISCNSSKETVQSNESTETRSEQSPRKGRMDMDKMFAEMDANNDGRLAKLEVKGRLAENFDKIDTDGDGFITKEEMKNAPKPRRGNRGQRQ